MASHSISERPASLKKRLSVAVLSLLVMFQPVLPTVEVVLADSISSGAQAGNDLWNDISADTKVPNTNGGRELTLPNGGDTIPMEELFQASSQDDSYTGMYNLSDAAFEERGFEGRQRLESERDSSEGQAYRVLQDSSNRSKPDLRNDPIWENTESVYDFIEGRDVTCTPEDAHTPDYRTCTRVNMDLDSCKVSHAYEVGVFEHIDGPVNLDSCGEGCMDFWIGKIGDNYWTGYCDVYEEAMSVRVLNPDAIISAKIIRAKWDDYMQVLIGGNKVWSGPNNNFPPETAGACELNTSWDRNPNADVTAAFKNAEKDEVVDMKVRVSVSGYGEGYAKIRVYYDPDKVVTDDIWEGDACIDKSKNLDIEYGSSGASCTLMPPLNGSGCLEENGVTVCPSKMNPSPISGINPLCKEITVETPSPVVAKNTCSAYESNPSCGFISSECDGQPTSALVTKLFKQTLGRAPTATEQNYWVNAYNTSGSDWDYLRATYAENYGLDATTMGGRSSCRKFVDTYDCGFDQASNAGACAVQDLFKDDFADCSEELVPQEITEDIRFEELETCTKALKLTECTVERELSSQSKSSSTSYFRGCFISDTVSYKVPWADSAISASATLSTSGQHTSASITQQPSPSNDWTVSLQLNGSGVMVEKEKKIPRTCGPGESGSCYVMEPCEVQDPDKDGVEMCYAIETYEEMECPNNSSLTTTVNVTGHSVTVSEENFPAEEENDPCFRDNDQWTESEWVCTSNASLVIGGVPTSMAALEAAIEPMYPGAPATCLSGDGTYTTKEYGQGDFCYENLNGAVTCETIDENNGVPVGTDNCAPLEARKDAGECTFLGEFPVEDGAGDTGVQYVKELRYDCGQSQEYTKTQMTPEYTCDGIVRCLGSECANQNRESSDQFEEAVAKLQALEQIGSDITCDPSTGGDLSKCRVFNGEAQTCKKALGGWVDCCETPSGVSLSNYITLISQTGKFDNFLMNSSIAEPVRGSYSALRDPVVDSAKYVTDAFTKQMDNISGTLGFGGGGGGGGAGFVDSATAVLDGFKQQMMSGAQDFLKDQFSEQVAEVFFQTGADGTVGLASGFSTALSVVGTIYTIYTVADIIVNIIWECTEDELNLGVDRQLKKTHYIGTYCAKDTFFGCIEKRESYCVFSTPLARILNAQARPQVGRGWGSAKSPQCQGITLNELETIDWSMVDLTEWLDILKVTDNMPAQADFDLSIDGLTGSGSYLGERTIEGGGTRLNSADRNVERLDGVDLDEKRYEASQSLWEAN